MKSKVTNWMRVALVSAVAAVSFACSNEFVSNAAPVELIVSNLQDLNTIDVRVGATGCDDPIGDLVVQVVNRTPGAGGTGRSEFNTVRLTRYRVSYVRTDGGSLVPAPFVRSLDRLVAPGESVTFEAPALLLSDAFSQQPFVALLPQNGGRDPETGRTTVRMDAVVDIFGETLAGSNVTARTRFPLEFCFNCGGCR